MLIFFLGLKYFKIGEKYSITPFGTTIYNNIAYEYDYFKDAVGNEIFFDSESREVDNEVIQLFGHNYILMCCNAFKSNESLSTNNIPGIFAKLLLSDSPGSIGTDFMCTQHPTQRMISLGFQQSRPQAHQLRQGRLDRIKPVIPLRGRTPVHFFQIYFRPERDNFKSVLKATAKEDFSCFGACSSKKEDSVM